MLKLTKYGRPLTTIFALAFAGDFILWIVLSIYLYTKVNPTTGIIFAVAFAALSFPVYAFLLLFFRDPRRQCDGGQVAPEVMLSPADGKITEISRIDDPRVGGPALKIGIFLSVFNVHINRSPCAAKVVESVHKCGEFLNAMNLDSSHRNECNDMILEPTDTLGRLPRRIVVRQIAGLIAKRIVCAVNPGVTLGAGERFGMIKFGSRTELIVPAVPEPQVLVQLGQAVHAGNDILLRY